MRARNVCGNTLAHVRLGPDRGGAGRSRANAWDEACANFAPTCADCLATRPKESGASSSVGQQSDSVRRMQRRSFVPRADIPRLDQNVLSAAGRHNRLPFRYPRHSHAVAGALESCKVSLIVARCVRAKPTNCEIRIERQSSLRFGPRLIEMAKPRQGGREAEMPDGIVAIELYAATQPDNCISVGVEVHFRDPDKMQPPKSSGIAGESRSASRI